ncbi:UNVERIFIED_CONTAM: hypothetical protein HDU68_000655 [Siphonaria sp. JEL0065]|nr:hypothetical protein HDU68_000655 [Siphonaria sp. JEL0065]
MTKMFELGLTSFDQLLNFAGPGSSSSGGSNAVESGQGNTDLVLDILDLDKFFETNSQPATANDPASFLSPSNSNDFVEIIGQPTDFLGYLNGGIGHDFTGMLMDGANSPFTAPSPFSECVFGAGGDSPFPHSASESSLPRQNSYPFVDMFSQDLLPGTTTTSTSMDLFSGDSLLDNMMTSCELESLDGSIASIPFESSQEDANTLFNAIPHFLHQHQNQHQYQLPFNQQNNVAAWLPNLPIPDKQFMDMRCADSTGALSSSLSSVSSLATTCSTISNASTSVNVDGGNSGASKPISRKRQHPTSTNNLYKAQEQQQQQHISVSVSASASSSTSTDCTIKKATQRATATTTTASTSTRPSSLLNATRSKLNAPKLHPPPSTTRSTNIPTTLPRTRPLMTTSSSTRASTTKTAFGSTIHSSVPSINLSTTATTGRIPASRSTTPRSQQDSKTTSRTVLGSRGASSLIVVAQSAGTSVSQSRSVRVKTPVSVTTTAAPATTTIDNGQPQQQHQQQQPLVPTRIPTPVSSLSSMIQQHQQQQKLQQPQQDVVMNDMDEIMEEGTAPLPPTATSVANKDFSLMATGCIDSLFDGLLDFPMDVDSVVASGDCGGGNGGIIAPVVAPAALGQGDIDWLF